MFFLNSEKRKILYFDLMICRNEDDPAYEDKSLQLKLEENKKVSRDRLNQVIEKFVQKQERKSDDEDEEDQDEEDDVQEEGAEDVDVPEMDQSNSDQIISLFNLPSLF